jgi:NTE family protein
VAFFCVFKSPPTMAAMLMRPLFLLALCLSPILPRAQALPSTADPATTAASAQPDSPGRPRLGLVLSGGGARGLAHVGVLKVLEREHIPVDVIAGTSMGAIIGGLYASGMRADEIERELLKVDWDRLFAQRVSRQQLSQRRKEEDFEIATAIELGWRDGEFRAPQGAVSSRGLETLLRRYTLPVRAVRRFDDLPIPFRAVATDMETGEALVMDHGDLATALRSSMSVPAVFPSTEVEGRVLGDGGLVNNVPVDVARAMGADRVIVVNIGTPLAARDTLNSVLGLTAQMISILTEQNVQRSLASLTPQDVLITPNLGKLTSADFAEAPSLIKLGEQEALRQTERLSALAIPEATYAAWRAERRAHAPGSPVLDFIAFEGTTVTNPARFAMQLESKPGEPFDPAKAARDTRTLSATGDYVRTDYRQVETADGHGLVLDLEDKPWGPNYLQVGLDLSTDFSGRSAFNIKFSHNRHWLTPAGSEWRNRIQIGEVPTVFTELYHPLNWTIGLSNDWFVSGQASVERRTQSLFDGRRLSEVGQVRRTNGRVGIDLGQPWGSVGELRVGLVSLFGRASPLLLSEDYGGPRQVATWRETGLRTRIVVDQLDFANFPQNGYRFEGEAILGRRNEEGRRRMVQLTSQGTLASTWGAHTLNLHAQLKVADSGNNAIVGPYSLGGFQQLSGYRAGQLTGNALLFGRAGWYMRLPHAPVFARGWFMGASLEAGQVWASRRDLGLSGLRYGSSLYVGADTGIGPMYLGLTWAPDGEAGLVLFIGRP